MPFSGPHKLLTMSGRNFVDPERWTVGIRFSGAELPTQSMVDQCVSPIRTWFTSTGAKYGSAYSIDEVKLAPIGADGKYPPGQDSVVSIPSPAIQGAQTTNLYPAQICLVASLTTAQSRGRAHIGRVYLPPPALTLQGTGLLDSVSVASWLAAFSTCLVALNAIAGMGSATVMSKFGQANTVTGLRAGLVLDTQRRRRRSLPENYVTRPLI